MNTMFVEWMNKWMNTMLVQWMKEWMKQIDKYNVGRMNE